MTPEKLNAIKQRLANATPGPWSWSGCSNDTVDICSAAPGWEEMEIAVATVDYDSNEWRHPKGLPVMDREMAHANAALIYNAPQDLSALMAEVERLRGVIRELHTLADTAVRDWDVMRVQEALREMARITAEEVKRDI